MAQLIKVSTVPTTESLVAEQARSIEQDMTQNLMYQGITLDQYLENNGFESKAKWLEREVKDTAVKRVKAGLALAELSKLESIEATSDELAAHIELYRQQYANKPEALKQFEQPEIQRDIANRLLPEKTDERMVALHTK